MTQLGLHFSYFFLIWWNLQPDEDSPFSKEQQIWKIEQSALYSGTALPRLFIRQFGNTNDDRCPQGHRQGSCSFSPRWSSPRSDAKFPKMGGSLSPLQGQTLGIHSGMLLNKSPYKKRQWISSWSIFCKIKCDDYFQSYKGLKLIIPDWWPGN